MTDMNANTTNVNSNHSDADINTINSRKSREDEQIVAHYTKEGAEPVERVKFEGLGDDDSICTQDSDNEKLPPIPDGGWGWVVVLSASIISTCTNGLAFSFGLLHEEITSYFQTTQAHTSLIGSLFIATPLLAGPIMSALVNRYGCRLTTMVAGVISATGFVLAALSNSVEMLCLTFGVISGLANGIFYVTPIVSVAFWFEKKRNFAFSLSFCGVGFGMFIYSPMTEYFLSKYDWRNTIVLLAGTLLNMCVCGALLKKPKWLEIKQKRQRKFSKRFRKTSGVLGIREAKELKKLLQNERSPEYIIETLTTNIKAETLETIQPYVKSATHLPTFVKQNEEVPIIVSDNLTTNIKLSNLIQQNYSDFVTRTHSEVTVYIDNETVPAPRSKKSEIKTSNPDEEKGMHDKNRTVHDEINLSRKIKRSNGYLIATRDGVNLESPRLRKISADHHKDIGVIFCNKLKFYSLPNMNESSLWSNDKESSTKSECHLQLLHVIKTTFHIKMFTEFHFLMFNISLLVLSGGFIVPFFFLTSYMTEMDVEGGADVMSVIGISTIIGLIVLGWTGDQPWTNVTKTFAVCLVICGLSVASYPLFITNFWMLAVVSAIFGFSFASSFSCTPGILMSLIPLDHTIVAYGMMLLLQGVGHLVGPPIGGLFYDVTGSWEVTFYVASACVMLSGLCVAVIAYTDDVRICGTDPLLMEVQRAKSNAPDVHRV